MWVRVFEFWYAKKLKENPKLKVVISDLRFIHEYEYLKKMDAYFIRIKRDIKENKFGKHISETELDKLELNCEMANNGTLEDLYAKVDDLIR